MEHARKFTSLWGNGSHDDGRRTAPYASTVNDKLNPEENTKQLSKEGHKQLRKINFSVDSGTTFYIWSYVISLLSTADNE